MPEPTAETDSGIVCRIGDAKMTQTVAPVDLFLFNVFVDMRSPAITLESLWTA
jgi:hypothetical protein